MDDKYWEALAERWEALRVAGLVWWVEGLPAGEYGYPVVSIGTYDDLWVCGAVDSFSTPTAEQVERPRPDLRDPATVGVLLSQWRKAFENPGACTEFISSPGRPDHWRAYPGIGVGQTEPEAIIAALEALEPPK